MEIAAGSRMNNLSSRGGSVIATIVGALISIVIVVGFALAGQVLGGLVFAKLEKLPSSIVGVGALYKYWVAYGDVIAVHRHLVMCAAIAGLVTVAPIALGVITVAGAKFKKRELHGSARFASVSEIRKSGLVGKDNG